MPLPCLAQATKAKDVVCLKSLQHTKKVSCEEGRREGGGKRENQTFQPFGEA